jgi:Zn-dependent protease with chaperone function
MTEPTSPLLPAVFFDGLRPIGRPAGVRLANGTMTVVELATNVPLAAWPYASVRQVDAPKGMLRLAHHEAGTDARLEFTDIAAGDAVLSALGPVRKLGAADRTTSFKIAGWTVAALASLAAFIIWGVPAIAQRLVPLVSYDMEVRLGESVRPQIIDFLGGKRVGAAECAHPAGVAALTRLVSPLLEAADLPLPVRVTVIKHPVPNAFALPGGQILILSSLMDKVETPEGVAAVLAHELGHVANRDGLNGLFQSAGLGLVFSVLVGDFSGGAIAVAVAQNLAQASYTRDAEATADRYAADLLRKVAQSPKALGEALARITEGEQTGGGLLDFFSTHPSTPDRARALAREPGPETIKPPLDAAGWKALQGICQVTKEVK